MQQRSMWDRTLAAATMIRERDARPPTIGVVLGSGLGAFAERLADPVILPYAEIPEFPVSGVPGHAGRLVIGTLHGVTVAAMQGRVHAYEGFPPAEVVFPVRVLWHLGVRTLILTNAAGGIGDGFQPGDLALITDHLNLTGNNPLVGHNDDRFGPRFPDVSRAWTPGLHDIARRVANRVGVVLREGTYAGMMGPTYETPAEVRFIRTAGGHMVGMSTVHEAIAAAHLGMRLMGVSCITNMAAGLPGSVLDHDDVQAVAARAREGFQRLLDGVIEQLAAGA